MNELSEFLILFHKFFERIGRKVGPLAYKPARINRVGLKDCFYEVFEPPLQVARHRVKLVLITPGAREQVCGGVFQRTELLLYVFSIAITFHILKYTQRGIKGHWEVRNLEKSRGEIYKKL
jgi:hypothetical protein